MVDTSQMLRIETLGESRVEGAKELVELAEFARSYLLSHKWVRRVSSGFLDRGLAPMLAVFYFEIEPIEADEAVWVIVGDIPPAYLDILSAPNGEEALKSYVWAMRRWVRAVSEGRSTHGLIPVSFGRSRELLPATIETAAMLEGKLNAIETVLIPWFEGGRWEYVDPVTG